MSQPVCDICGKSFTKKAGLQKHKERKNPCKAPVALLQTDQDSESKEEDISSSSLDVPMKPMKPIKPMKEFRESSMRFNASLSKEERLEQGIFFTPKKARDVLFRKLEELHVRPRNILEPSFGSGEFLLDACRLYPDSHLWGVEKNEELFQSVECPPNCTLTCGDFLTWNGKADLIIGNPPYFVWKTDKMSAKEKREFTKKYSSCMTGRPNIYVLFLYKCLEEHLEEDGFLAFIIPTSLYNCSYYQPMRNYIQKHTTICHLENLNKPGFYETGQETMLIILQKKKTHDEYIFRAKNGDIYISPFYRELYDITQHTTTLQELGLGVKTGNVIWNNVKDHLSEEGTLLIYSSNITPSGLKLNNLCGKVRKQYVRGLDKPTLNGPVILVERGYGNSYGFHSVLVTLNNFYAENHINVIYPKTAEAIGNLERVARSFQDEKSLQFINWFVGNGSVSATMIETLLPIFE